MGFVFAQINDARELCALSVVKSARNKAFAWKGHSLQREADAQWEVLNQAETGNESVPAWKSVGEWRKQ